MVYLINVFGKRSQCHLFLHPVFCFKYKFTKVIISSDKPYAWIFAAIESWRIQSKALERSIRTVATKVLLSRNFFHISLKIRHDLNYKIFYKLIWNFIILFLHKKKGYCDYIFHNFRHSIQNTYWPIISYLVSLIYLENGSYQCYFWLFWVHVFFLVLLL